MKTYKRRFLASLTECSPEELFGSASELLWLAFSQTCSEASFTRSSSSGDEKFVPNHTSLSNHTWDLQKKEIEHTISWKILALVSADYA